MYCIKVMRLDLWYSQRSFADTHAAKISAQLRCRSAQEGGNSAKDFNVLFSPAAKGVKAKGVEANNTVINGVSAIPEGADGLELV